MTSDNWQNPGCRIVKLTNHLISRTWLVVEGWGDGGAGGEVAKGGWWNDKWIQLPPPKMSHFVRLGEFFPV